LTEAPRNADGRVEGQDALESVRRLEETLEGQRDLKETSRERVEAARKEAEEIVREAREEALRAAEEHRMKVLAEADQEVERMLEEAGDESRRLLALAEEDRFGAADEVVAWLVPGGEES
jgi:cell division septum initiation protein DivIVA